jgi:hypothetical protein
MRIFACELTTRIAALQQMSLKARARGYAQNACNEEDLLSVDAAVRILAGGPGCFIWSIILPLTTLAGLVRFRRAVVL